MNKLSLIFIFFSIFTNYAQQEENSFLKVEYKIIHSNPKFKEALKENPVMAQKFKGLQEAFDNLRYELLIGKGESLFKKVERMQSDTENTLLTGIAQATAGTNGTFYINKEKHLLLHRPPFLENALIKISLPKYNWVLHNEIKVIAGYICRRATAEKPIENALVIDNDPNTEKPQQATQHIEAWFAPDLPGVFGPADFVGLPGLVLRINRETVQLEAISIEQIKNPQIEKPTANNIYSPEEYTNKMMERINNLKKQKRKN